MKLFFYWWWIRSFVVSIFPWGPGPPGCPAGAGAARHFKYFDYVLVTSLYFALYWIISCHLNVLCRPICSYLPIFIRFSDMCQLCARKEHCTCVWTVNKKAYMHAGTLYGHITVWMLGVVYLHTLRNGRMEAWSLQGMQQSLVFIKFFIEIPVSVQVVNCKIVQNRFWWYFL